MLYEFTGVCQNCGSEVSITIHNGEPLEDCPDCKESPFSLKKYKGLIYVVSNANQQGVKIGLTEKTLEQRLKGLNQTGVPGKFTPIVIFPSDRPKADEKKVHEKLSKKNLAKEHFDVEPIEAALACYRALNKRKPIFFDKDIEETFHLMLEEARIKMQLRLKGKKSL